jgi:phospholipid/cholesterol/gamma-HCH transport system permease protein
MPSEAAIKSGFSSAVEDVGRNVVKGIEDLGTTFQLAIRIPILAFRRPFRLAIWLQQLEAIGVGSLFIVTLTGFFVGAVLSLQMIYAFGLFNAQSLVGATVELTLSRELAPVFAGLMLTARAGSAIATELGSMRVTEQIDALETMAVDSEQYLIVPRVLSGFVMLPLLTIVFNAVAIFGAYLVAVVSAGLSVAEFEGRIRTLVEPGDIMQGLVKAAIFGYVVCLIAAQRGYYAEGGAAGVGVATTRAVVGGSISILALDYCLTALQQTFGWFSSAT